MPIGARPVFFCETDLFKNWLKEKGYTWPEAPWAQQNLLAEFWREGLRHCCDEPVNSFLAEED